MSRKAVAAMIALNALRGWFAPIPSDMDVAEILREMPEMGGLSLSESAKEISARASKIDNSRITYIAVNVVDSDVLITMLVDTPEQRLTTEKEILANDGYAFAFVYNDNAPWCSEYGDVVVAKQRDGHLRRVG